MRTAPACPPTPPPCAVTTISIWSARFVNFTGSVASCFHAKFGKYCSIGRPFTVNLPEPGRTNTRAMDSLRRPVPWNQVLLDASALKTSSQKYFQLNSRKDSTADSMAIFGLNPFELPTRLIPCGGLHLTCVEGPPTCGNSGLQLPNSLNRQR